MKKDNITRGLLKGIPVSEGIAIGCAWILESLWDEVSGYSLDKDAVKKENKRYKRAVEAVEQQLVECRDRVKREIGSEEAKIFESHLSILNDLFFQKEIPQSIQSEKKNAEWLLKEGIERWNQSFQKMKSEFFRNRIDDIKDVAVRILRILLQSEELKLSLENSTILVAHDLSPSDTARIDRNKIVGFATELGGQTSHASILARSMGLPAVVGVERLMKQVHNGDPIIVDGNAGIVYIDPPQRIVKGYEKRQKQFNAYWNRLSQEVRLPAVTTDGVDISLQANVSMTADISLAVRYRADGIGLFRTELPFLIAGKLLNEDEQLQIYRTVVEAMKDKMVTIRTLDLGGDKFLPFQDVTGERNPFLGWRSIRISLQERDIFKIQLRAMMRASAYGRVRILFPMISSLEEIQEICEVMEEVKAELEKDQIPFDSSIQSGVMIEVPSAALMMDRLVKYTDFVSIGTNDLIQYTLAVDRNNEKVAKFYKPVNPAILMLIHKTIQAANQAGIPVSLCGEMAGNPLYTSLLLGFGLRQLSMSPLTLMEVKERVRAISIQECEKVAERVLQMDFIGDIEKVLLDFHLKANKKQSIPHLENRIV
ncbi:phosphoenolpyruvate--protein phosphotransferase [bacterium]|nr:phosphoenolpyruvate--protein phosphotransferase [bacterium]RQV95262.1 MAG: phosphoenolpyruvate--protein phosphotransferase [bacterium]